MERMKPARTNRTVAGLAGTTLVVAVLAGLAQAQTQAQKDGDAITIGTWRTFHSEILGEDRQILVHLPEGYEKSVTRHPVLFHLYGQQVTHYFADAVMTTERLAGAADIPPMIVVGVANTDRYRDNLPIQADGKTPGGADAFLRFFAEELIPFVDKHYRTKPYRMLAGPQAGGAFGLYALMTSPGLFNASILRIENPFPGEKAFRQFFLDRATAFAKDTPRLNAFVRLNVESTVQAPTLEFAKAFAGVIDLARPEGLRFELHVEEPSGDFVRLVGLAPALRSLFAGYKLPANPPPDTVEAIEAHYKAFSARVGGEFEPPELSLTFAVDYQMGNRRLEEALALVTYELRLYPDHLNALWRLGEINRRMGRFAEAREAYKRFLAIQPTDASMVQQRLAEVEKALEIKKD